MLRDFENREEDPQRIAWRNIQLLHWRARPNGQAIRTGYYWPSLHEDAVNLVRSCNKCQKNSPPSSENPPPP